MRQTYDREGNTMADINVGSIEELTLAQKTWIAKFNKEKGWKNIKAPSPKGEKLKKSPVHRLEEKHEQAKIEAENAQNKWEQLAAKVEESKLAVENLKKGDKLKQAKAALAKLEVKAAEARVKYEAKFEVLTQRGQALQRIITVEARLDTLLDNIVDEIKELESREIDPTKSATKDEIAAYQKSHDKVARSIGDARAETFTMRETDGDESIDRTYSIINKVEYKILFGMLEKAMLIFRIDGMKEAKAQLQSTVYKLNEFRSARTGKVEKTDTKDRGLDTELANAGSNISYLRTRGYTDAADDLEETRQSLRSMIKKMSPSEPNKVHGNLGNTVKDFAEHCLEEMRAAGKIAEIHAQIETKIEGLRSLNQGKLAIGHETKLKGFDPGIGIKLSIYIAEDHLKLIEKDVNDSRAKAMGESKLNLRDLRGEVNLRRDVYGQMFKHDKSGAIKTQKDRETQLPKNVKKDSKIPREALDEIELRLGVADMLLACNSIETLKQVPGYMDSLRSFEDSVVGDSDKYSSIAKALSKANEKIQRMEQKYRQYEIGERMQLKDELDKLEGAYRAQSPAETQARAVALLSQATKLKEKVQKLNKSYEEIKHSAGKITESIDQLGDLLDGMVITELKGKNIKGKKIKSVKLDGYYGKSTQELKDAQAIASKRDGKSLTEAKDLLKKLDAEITDRIRVAIKHREVGRGKLDPGESKTWRDLKKDAVEGQIHDIEKKQDREKFNDKQKEVLKIIEKVADKYKKLKLNSAELDLIKQRIVMMTEEIAGSEEYVDGIERLEKLKTEVEGLKTEAASTAKISKMGVVDAAKDYCVKVEAFAEFAGGLFKRIAKTATFKQSLSSEAGDIKSFLEAVASVVSKDELKNLLGNAGRVADPDALDDEARKARETALMGIRAMKAALDTYGPVKHFRSQPFEPGNVSLGEASKALPRLEIKLLTALGKKKK